MKNYFTPLWCITLFLALNLLSSVTVQAADRYAVANGNWDAASTWSATSGGTGGASIPVAGDDVYFGETTTAWTVTIPNGYAAACSNLFIGSNNIVAQTLTLSTATGSLAVSGNVILYGPINTTGNVSRTLNVNAGTLSIGGNLELGNGQNGISGNRRCIVNITTGSITVNGNIIFDNVIGSAATQTQIVFTSAGSLNLAGTFTINNNSGTLTPGTTSTFNFNGSTFAQTIPIGVSLVTYANINCNNTSAGGATLSAAITGVNVIGNLQVQTGILNNGGFAINLANNRSFSVSNDATFNLFSTSGMVTVLGTGTKTFGSNSIVDYAGSSQTVSNESYGGLMLSGSGTKTLPATPVTVNSLAFNNSNGVLLNSDLTINNLLTLTSGNISTGSSTLTISSSGTVSRTSGHIIGNLKKNSFTGNKTFEVGTANGYTPVNLVATGNGDFTVRSVGTSHPNASGTNILQMYWTLTNGGLTSADLTFNYLDADVVGDENQYELGRYNGSWAFLSPITLNTTANTVSINGINSFSDWTLGEPGALPVELSSFTASVISSTVKLSWQTATEINNYGFEVERASLSASPLQVWEKIGFVNGNGNSNSPNNYSYEDKNVTAGKYSYRLKQIDNDGQFEYSKTIVVDFNGVKKFELSQNYPNPFNPTTTIRFNIPEAGNVKLTLFNILGQEIRTLVNEYKESGVHTINLNASELNSGMYIYQLTIHSDKIEAGSFTQTRKMTLVK